VGNRHFRAACVQIPIVRPRLGGGDPRQFVHGPTLNCVTGLPLTHGVAHRLARAGLRGSAWYWRLARLCQRTPGVGVVRLPDGMPLMHDPSDWTCRTAYEGTYEREILRLLDDLLDDGDVVVDVGANVGIISAYASGLVGPTGRVIAVEPSPRCLGDLHAVTDGLDNVTVVEAALGAENEMVNLTGWDNPDHRGLGSVVPGHRAGLAENWFEGEACEVAQLRLEDLLTEHIGCDSPVGLLKVDVEGYEPMVLKGAPDLFRDRQVRSAILEVTTTLSVDWVGDLLREATGGYDAFMIGERGWIKRRLDLKRVDAETAMQRSAQWNLLLLRR